MSNLIEALTFMVSTFGAINILAIFVGSGILASKFVSSMLDSDRKAKKLLIKETLKEFNDGQKK